jgi:pre-mRNA cleavage complex 2 protein Pcf11
VPTDLEQAKKPCSICQEKFEVEWHKELEQPVWKDAIKVGPKYYHATCYAEVSKGNAAAAAALAGQSGNSARSTPDRVLGKRTFDHFKQDTQAS